MAYNPEAPFAIPGFALEPLVLEDVGDPTAGPGANLKSTFEKLRRFRGYHVSASSRNAISSPAEGDFVLMLHAGNRIRVDVFYPGTGWTPWGDSPAGAHTRYQPLTESPPGSGRYNLFGSMLHERITVDRIPQFEGPTRDYTVDTSVNPYQVVFNAGRIPAPGREVYGAVSLPGLSSTNADTLRGAPPDKGQLPGGVVVRQADGSIEGVGGSDAQSLEGYDTLPSPEHAPNRIPYHDDDGGLDATTLGGFRPSAGYVGDRVVVRGPSGAIAGYGATGGVNADTIEGYNSAVSPTHTPETIPVHDEHGNLDATSILGLVPSTDATPDAIVQRDEYGRIAGAGSDAATLEGYVTAVSPTHTANTIPVHDEHGNLDATTLGGAQAATSGPDTILKRKSDGSIDGLSADKDTVDGYDTVVSPTHTANKIPVHSAGAGLDCTTLGGVAASATVVGNTIVKRDGSGVIAGVASGISTLDGYDTVVSPTHTPSRIPVHDASGGLDATTLGGAAPSASATANAIVKRDGSGAIAGASGAAAVNLDGYDTIVSPSHAANKIPVHDASGGLDATTLGGAVPATSGPDTILKRKSDGSIEGVSGVASNLELVLHITKNGSQSLTTAKTQLTGWTEVYDKHSAWSSNELTCKTSGSGGVPPGRYRVYAGFTMTAGTSGALSVGVEINVHDGEAETKSYLHGFHTTERNSQWACHFNFVRDVDLVHNEILLFGSNKASASYSLNSGANNTWVKVYRVI